MSKPRRPKGFKATTWVDSTVVGFTYSTDDPLGFLDVHDAWSEVDWSQAPQWSEELKEAEARLRALRLRIEALHDSSRRCAACGEPIAGRADKRYCSTRCRVRGHREPVVR